MNKYYDDYRATSFTAEVVDIITENANYWVGTSETCFYVEGGGMAKDEGWLNGLPVFDVKYENGKYYHLVNSKLSGLVKGEVDYPPRLKKVQIHSAQHLISALLGKHYNLMTSSHHVSEEGNDVVFRGNNNDVDLEKLQEELNACLLQNLPITVSYPSFEEASKHAAIEKLQHEDLRVVQIGDLDYNLCGCLHVRSLAEIGMIFLKSWQATKEGGTISYLAGQQIIDYFQPRLQQLEQATKLLALDHLAICEGIIKLQQENKKLNYSYSGLKQEKLENLAASYLKETGPLVLEVEGWEVKEGQFFLSYLNGKGFVNEVGLVLKLEGDHCHVLIGSHRAKELFSEVAAKFNLKGGGNEKVAQGGGPYNKEIVKYLMKKIGD